jgi:TonB family protein
MFIWLVLIYFLSFNIVFAQGAIKTFYDNGKLKSEINYSNNIRDGEAKFYYENGDIKREENYVNGKVEGLVKKYKAGGKLQEVFNIENGRREGPTSIYDSSGIYLTDINFENGVRVKDISKEIQSTETEVAVKKPVESKVREKVNVKKTNNSFLPPAEREENLESDPAFYLTAEVMPEPVGGLEALEERLFYPSLAKEKKVEGVVKILAFIDQYGDVTKADVVQGIGYGCDESARIAVFYSRFKPGLIKGKPVKVQMVITLNFKLKD